MDILYKDCKDFSEEELGRLFLSVGWASGHYPHKLQTALRGYSAVYSAWEGDRLAGLAAAMDDGVMTAYVHYLLVEPAFQGRGIGRALLRMLKEHYDGFLKIVLIASAGKEGFYGAEGFTVAEGTPMYLTSMEN